MQDSKKICLLTEKPPETRFVMADFQHNHILVTTLPPNVINLAESFSATFDCKYSFISNPQITVNIVLQYFSKRYGDVDSVASYTESERRFAMVTFKRPTDAAKASAALTHCIDKHVLNVLMPDAIQQSMDFLSFNDDCILAIMDYLNLKDLCNLASVCNHLQELAIVTFSAKWRDHTFIIDSGDEMFEAYLRNFGSIATAIRLEIAPEFESSVNSSIILSSLMKYRSNALTHLELANFRFETRTEFIAQSRTLFIGVKKMILTKCTISVKWIVLCQQLVELELIDSHVTYNGAPLQMVDSLRSLKINGSTKWVQNGLHLFLQSNPQLQCLEVIPLPNARKTYWYGQILDFVPENIKQLSIEAIGSGYFERFVSLKDLRISSKSYYYDNDDTCAFFNRLTTNATLENLEIMCHSFYGDFARSIAKIRTLKSLKFNLWGKYVMGELTNANVFHMASHLNRMRELTLSSFHNLLDADDLLHLIKICPNLQLLGLSFHNIGKLKMCADFYQKMLNVVSHRSQKNQLQIVTFECCCAEQNDRIDATCPVHPTLQVVHIFGDAVVPFLDPNDPNFNHLVRVTDVVLKKLRDCGLLEAAPDTESA